MRFNSVSNVIYPVLPSSYDLEIEFQIGRYLSPRNPLRIVSNFQLKFSQVNMLALCAENKGGIFVAAFQYGKKLALVARFANCQNVVALSGCTIAFVCVSRDRNLGRLANRVGDLTF